MEQENWSLSNNPGGQEDTINLRHYWHVILERRWLIITAFISVFVLSLIYLFKATPIYRATTKLQIDPETDSVLRIEGIAVSRQEQDYLQTQYKNLMSRTLIQSVVSKLGLDKDERYAKSKDPVKAVASDIQIAPIRLSRLVDINAEHPDPAKAAQIANTIATNFIQTTRDQKVQASLDVVGLLTNIAKIQKQNLEEAELALQKYSETNKTASFEEGANIIAQALKQMKTDHSKAESDATSAETEARQVAALLRDGMPASGLPQVVNDQDIQQLHRELSLAQANLAELSKRYQPEHFEYIKAQAKVQKLEESYTNQVQATVGAIRARAEINRSIEQELALKVVAQEKELIDLNEKKIKYLELKRVVDQYEKLYNAVLARATETELTGREKVVNMRVVDWAPVPLNPVKPRTVLTLFLGLVGGIGVALGLAFFVNYLDDSIKSQDDVETYLRLSFLGYVPNIKTNSVVERDMQAHLHPQSNAAEGFRTIRATISLTHKPDKFRILSITSTIPSEGKSLVASNLAIVTAQTGLKTLLIDADLRRPSVHKAYQLHSPVGLSSYLMEDIDKVDRIIHKTEVPNLDVICCGSVPSTPSELIGSKRMLDFLQTLRAQYDRIILDCPPISAVSDPLIIAAMSDGVVFVTKFNKIRREHARKSVQRIQNAGIHIVGVVLNDIDFEGKDSYYYSYYYYQNRYYSSHYRTGADRGKEKPAPAKAQDNN